MAGRSGFRLAAGRFAWAGLAVVCVLAGSAASTAGPAGPRPADASRTGSERISVLVGLDPERSARERLRDFAGAHAAALRYEYGILPDLVNLRDLPADAVDALRRLPGVLRVEEDYRVSASLTGSTPLIHGLQSQIAAAHLVANGNGVRVCVVDTGIDSNHVMYASRIDTAAGYDFVHNDPDPEDDNGHGAHVAGIAVGRAGLRVDFGCGAGPEPLQGVAPAATLIGMKVLDAEGGGYASDVIAGIERCASPTLPGGPADVINLSLGKGRYREACDDDPIAAAVNRAHAAGVVVVAAAGNGNSSQGLETPACASNAIAVGAVWDATYPTCEVVNTEFTFCTAANASGACTESCTDSLPLVDSRACFSNRSALLDVTAPGCVIYSADSANASGYGIAPQCGTSQAAAHVTGLAALILGLAPTLAPSEVRQLIRDGAIDLGTPGFDTSYGHGRIDVVRALELACGPDGDGDGWRDCLDRCPLDPDKTAPGSCGCGVVDDADGDGALSCAGDCDDRDGSTWGTPGEVLALRLAHDLQGGVTRLSWSPPLAPGARELRYDTLRADSPAGFASAGTCIESGGDDRETADATPPEPGHAFFYLVRGLSRCAAGEGSLGFDSSGSPRKGCSCP